MLSITSEYALRALAHLARTPAGSTILGRELAKKAGIPANYLSKILLSLRNAGFVATARGSRGGYSLLRPADSIRLVEIVEVFEGPAARPSCLIGVSHPCSASDPCSAHDSWHKVGQAFLQYLENTTLTDIARAERSSAATR